MPIPLGVLAVAGAGGGAAAGNAYEWLATIAGNGSSSSITFNNLNTTYGSTYKHLQIRAVIRSTTSSSNGDLIRMQINGSEANYGHHLYADTTSTPKSRAEASGYFGYPLGSQTTDGGWSPCIIDIYDAFSTNKTKTIRIMFNGRRAANEFGFNFSSLLFNSTTVTSSIALLESSAFDTSSRFSLYGLRSA